MQFPEMQVFQLFQYFFTQRCEFNQDFTAVFLALASDGNAALH